jgi:hypothetical protein
MRAAWQPAGARRTLYPAPEARWCAPEGRCTAICAWYCAMPRGAPAEYEPARMAPESSSPLRRQSACRPGPGLAAASADQFLSSASFGGGGLNRGRERPRLLFAKTILIYSRWEKLNAPTLHTALCAAGRRQARGHAGRGALRQASVAVVATPGSAMPEIVDKAPLGYNPPLDQRPDPWTINLRPRASMKPFRGAPW